jgi:hypothetical protein
MAVDGSHLYWTDSEAGKIGRANLDGSGVTPSFIAGADAPAGLAVDGLPAAVNPPSPPAGGPPDTSPTRKPSNAFKVAKPKLNKQAGTATITATLPGPGKLVLKGKGVKKVTKHAKRNGKVALTVKPLPKTSRELAASGKVAVALTLTFTPSGGDPRSKPVGLTLKLAG